MRYYWDVLTFSTYKNPLPSPRQRLGLGAHRGPRPTGPQAVCPHGCLQRYPLSTWWLPIQADCCWVVPGSCYPVQAQGIPLLCLQTKVPFPISEPCRDVEMAVKYLLLRLTAQTLPSWDSVQEAGPLFLILTKGRSPSLSCPFSSPFLPGGVFSSDSSSRNVFTMLCVLSMSQVVAFKA